MALTLQRSTYNRARSFFRDAHLTDYLASLSSQLDLTPDQFNVV